MYMSDPTLTCSLLLFNAKVKLIEPVLVHVTNGKYLLIQIISKDILEHIKIIISHQLN